MHVAKSRQAQAFTAAAAVEMATLVLAQPQCVALCALLLYQTHVPCPLLCRVEARQCSKLTHEAMQGVKQDSSSSGGSQMMEERAFTMPCIVSLSQAQLHVFSGKEKRCGESS